MAKDALGHGSEARGASGAHTQGVQKAGNKSFWGYKAASPTPTMQEAINAGAIHPRTSDSEWNQLSSGMKREIVRTNAKLGASYDPHPLRGDPLHEETNSKLAAYSNRGNKSASTILASRMKGGFVRGSRFMRPHEQGRVNPEFFEED